jgi:hypothetical protein
VSAQSLSDRADEAAEQERAQCALAAKALRAGRQEEARAHAEAVGRSRAQRLQMVRLSTRMSSVADNVASAAAFASVSDLIAGTAAVMARCTQDAKQVDIASALSTLESSFERMQTSKGIFDDSAARTCGVASDDSTDDILQRIADENHLQFESSLVGRSPALSDMDDLEARWKRINAS